MTKEITPIPEIPTVRAWEIDPETGMFVGDLPHHPEAETGSEYPHIVLTPCPEGFYTPRWDGTKWVEGSPEKRLPRLRRRLKEDVNAIRRETLQTFGWNGHTWDTDAQSLQNLNGIITAVNNGFSLPQEFTWRDADNVDVPMTQQDLVALGLAVTMRTNLVYKHSFKLKADIDNAADPDTVDINQGWPV